MFGSLLNTTSAKQNRSRQYPNKHHIRKRHWVLGSLVILVGSWITHSTTATISDSILIDHSTQFYSAQPEPLSHQADSSNQVEILPVKSEPPEPLLIESVHTVKKGETLGSIFKKRKLDLALPHHISQHEIAKQLVSLSIGKALTFRTNQLDQLKQISYPISPLQNLLVEIDDNSISDAKVVDLPFKTVKHTVSADIKTSLYEAALDAGLSIQLVMEMVLIFGWDIDFVQDIRSGDSFHVIYQDYNLNGEKLADGNILAAEFTTQNQTYRAVRFEDKQGNASYYTPLGESMLGTFLRSPVEFSRISSRFGNRKHPILKTWRAHKGVDYAARRGTPIRATADGKIILAGNKGGYGRTVVIRHAGRFSTLYGHMNGFAKGIRSGKKVSQGDVIGYIGSTGLATGPHLHYEFRVDGVHRNPLTYKTPKASSVAAESLDDFTQLAQQRVAELDSISRNYQLAKAKTSDTSTAEL